jgi:hypothetical protein
MSEANPRTPTLNRCARQEFWELLTRLEGKSKA